MLKINPYFYIFNFNKTPFNGVNNKVSDWFQFILLNLIDISILSGKNCSDSILFSEPSAENFEDNKNLSPNLFKNEVIKDLVTYLGYIIEEGVFQEGNFFPSSNESLNKEGLAEVENLSLDNKLNSLDNKLDNNSIIPEKFSSLEEIISLLPLSEDLTNNKIFISKFNKVLAEILDRVDKKDFLRFHEGNKEDKVNWLGFLRLFKKMQDLGERQNERVFYIQEFNNGLDVEKLQNMINNSSISVEESLNIKNFNSYTENTNLYSSLKPHLEKIERGSFVSYDVKSLRELESYANSSGIEKEIKKFFNFKNMGKNVVSEKDEVIGINTGLLKKNILEKEIKFYDNLNKNFEIQINPFQKVLNQELIKNFSELGNINKPMDTKNINFPKLPEEFTGMVKDMVLKIYPEGEKKALIKLEPPDMGFLDLEIKVKDKNIEIILKAEKQEILQEIRQSLPYIKTSLEESGLNLKNFQLFLGSGFDGRDLVKNFQREEENYSFKKENEEIRELNERMFIYNEKGNYYYIV